MRYNIQAGSHSAQVDITMDGKGGFAGAINNTDYGSGTITDGVQTGEELKGNVVLGGHNATFDATISGASISGRISTHIFLIGDVGQDFTGTQEA